MFFYKKKYFFNLQQQIKKKIMVKFNMVKFNDRVECVEFPDGRHTPLRILILKLQQNQQSCVSSPNKTALPPPLPIQKYNLTFFSRFNLTFSFILFPSRIEGIDSMDPAILSCVASLSPAASSTGDPRIRYSRDALLSFRNSLLTRKRPAYVDDAIAARRCWCRLVDLGDERISRIGSSGGGGGGGLSSAAASAATGGSSGLSGGSGGTTIGTSFMLPTAYPKRNAAASSATTLATARPKKDEPCGTTTTSTLTSTTRNTTGRGGGGGGGVYVAGPGGTGAAAVAAAAAAAAAGGTTVATAADRRIGSGRIMARCDGWEYRSGSAAAVASSNDKEQTDSDYNFRPSGGLLGLRDRDRDHGGSGGSTIGQSDGGGSGSSSNNNNNRDRSERNDRMDRLDRNDFRTDDRYDRRPQFQRGGASNDYSDKDRRHQGKDFFLEI